MKTIRIVNNHTGAVKHVGENIVKSGALELHGWRVDELPQVPKELMVEEATEVVEEATEVVDLASLTLNKLKEKATENGINIPRNATKTQLINLLKDGN
jgi:hypothetical protein